MNMFLKGTIVYPLKKIPPIFNSATDTTKFFSVWQTVRMGLFSLGLGVLVGGGLFLRYI